MLDYYKLLQLDRAADSDMIELAYKKLAKKYHPDVCKVQNGLEMMRQINEAYEVLSIPGRRSEYDRQLYTTRQKEDSSYRRQYAHNASMDVEDLKNAHNLLVQYFEAIIKKDYLKGYQLINSNQRELMSLSAFKNWQHWTSRVYDLIDFKLSSRGYMESVIFNGTFVDYLITFDVEILEYNQIMEHYESGRFVKQVMVINHTPSVYLEQIEVSDIIRRYERLAKLKVGKWQAGRMKLAFNTNRVNPEFFRQLDKELERFARYEIPFSLVFLRIANAEQASIQNIINQMKSIIDNHLRKLDEYVLMEKHTFLLLLPSTRLYESTIVAEKICEIATTKESLKPLSFTVKRIIIENERLNIDELRETIQQVLIELNREEVKG